MRFSDEAVRELIYRSSVLLDSEDFESFLRLCSENFRYRITAYSPEIRKEMIWMRQDRKGFAAVCDILPEHLRRAGTRLMRHVSGCLIERVGSGETASVSSSVLVIHTNPEGRSSVFAAGRYLDVVDVTGETPKLVERNVKLDTRDLGPGSHVPI